MRILINARNASVAVDAGVIVDTGGRFDVVIDAPDANVRPGLINAHDHLHRNHYGRLGEPLYRNAHDWAADIQLRYQRRIAAGRRRPRRSALLAGAWKNLFSGVTTVVHHDRWESDFDNGFPLRVVRLATADNVQAVSSINPANLYAVHCAEGTDSKARADIGQLESRGLLTTNLLAVHAVGVDAEGIDRIKVAGAAVVWCPTSNMFMLGATASDALLTSGIDVLIGSDSLLTGAGNLLDELRFARARGPLSGAELERAVGSDAAARLGLAAPSIAPGANADLVLIRKPIGEAAAEDVAMVMVAGVPMVASPDLAPTIDRVAPRGGVHTVGGVRRWANIGAARAAEGGSNESH